MNLLCQPSTLLLVMMFASKAFYMGTRKRPFIHVFLGSTGLNKACTSGTLRHTGYSKCDLHTETYHSLSTTTTTSDNNSSPLPRTSTRTHVYKRHSKCLRFQSSLFTSEVFARKESALAAFALKAFAPKDSLKRHSLQWFSLQRHVIVEGGGLDCL